MLIRNLSFLVGLEIENKQKTTFRQDDNLAEFLGFLFPNYPERMSFGGFTLENPKKRTFRRDAFLD